MKVTQCWVVAGCEWLVVWQEGVTRQAGRQWSGVGSERVQRWLGGRCSGAGTPHHVAAAAGPGDTAAPADPAAPH